jgi:SAM-dependent methyltransferase
LLELATGYQRSKILFALIDLGLPTLLAERPRSLEEIAATLGADPLAADRFLNACVALGLLVREGDRFRNGPESEHFLVRGTPAYLGDLLGRYHRTSYSAAWAQFPQRLCAWRAGRTADLLWVEGAVAGAELEGRHRLTLLTGDALGVAVDLSLHRRLLDLGGGTGGMSIALCRRFPALRAVIVEVAGALPAARERIRASGLADRIEVLEGDLVDSPLPPGCDVVLLANVLSMLSATASRSLLARLFDYLPSGGTAILSGWMLDCDKTGPLLSALFCMEDIILGAPDVERTSATYADWLAQAGFRDVERATYFEPAGFVLGRKP